MRPATTCLASSLGLLLSLSATAAPAVWPDLSRPLSSSAGDGSKDAALVVGIESYAAAQPIPGARDNALAWVSWLSDARRVPVVKPLLDQQAVKEELLASAVQVAGQVRPGGTLWLVYIGHGAPAREGDDGLLVGWDAQQTASSIEARGLPQATLLSAVEAALPAGARVVMVVDACFSGKTAGGDLAPGLAPLKPVEARVTTGRTTVLTAAQSNEYAGPLSDGKRPAFSYLALGALRGWGDSDGDGAVSASEVHAYAGRALLQTVTGRSQTPSLSGEDVALSLGREAGPDLVDLSLIGSTGSRPIVVSSGGGGTSTVDVDALLAAKAQKDAVITEQQAEAAALWLRMKPLLDDRSPETELAVQAFVDVWSKAEVVVEDASGRRALPVPIPELVEARAWLGQGRLVAPAPAPVPAVPSNGPTAEKLGYQMVKVPAGWFTMGSPVGETGREADETPHEVEISRAFLIGKTEVTQAQWQAVMGSNPSSCELAPGWPNTCGPSLPVQNLSFSEAARFANALSANEGLEPCYELSGDEVVWPRGLACRGYRLPTEAEWEYAGRGGGQGLYAGVTSESAVCTHANVMSQTDRGKAKTRPHFPCTDQHKGLAPVGSYQPNAFGLQDMTGNVWELTWDWYEPLPADRLVDPTGPASGTHRVQRGCDYFVPPEMCRLAFRPKWPPQLRNPSSGLRLARSLP